MWTELSVIGVTIGSLAHIAPEFLLSKESPVGKFVTMPLGTQFITVQRILGVIGVLSILPMLRILLS